MIDFTMNGKDYSNEDMNILICKDSVTGQTDLQIYCDNDDIKLNNENAEIKISIEIISDDDLCAKFEENKSVDSSLFLIKHAVAVIKREADNIKDNYDSLSARQN